MSKDKENSNPEGEKKPDEFEYQFPSLHEELESGEKSKESEKIAGDLSASLDENLGQEPADLNGKAGLAQKSKSFFIQHRRLTLVVGFVVIGGLIWVLKSHPGSGGPGDPGNPSTPANVDEVPVNVVEVKMGRFQDKIETTGETKGEAEIELRFEVDGIIQRFDVTEGQRIQAGTLIAQLNDKDVILKVRRAQNELEQLEKLYNMGGVSLTKVKEARLNLEIAQAELAKTKLIASRAGIIGDKAAEVGEFVNQQRKIATLVSIKHVVVKAGIIEKDVDKVFPGQKVLVTVDAYPGNIFEGKVDTISPMAGGGGRTFEMATKIPNPENLLLPGMFARLKIVTYEADDALFVPNDALVKSQAGFEVYVVDKDNVAKAREVSVSHTATDQSQIEAGLTPGEIVVLQKPPELKDGARVKIIEVQK